MYISIHTYIYTYIHISRERERERHNTYIYIYICVCIYLSLSLYIYIYIHTCGYIYIYACVRLHVQGRHRLVVALVPDVVPAAAHGGDVVPRLYCTTSTYDILYYDMSYCTVLYY